METKYWKGDKAKYTGKFEDGQHQLELLEGHRKGELVWTSIGPDGSNPMQEQVKREWAAQQADFRKLSLKVNI